MVIKSTLWRKTVVTRSSQNDRHKRYRVTKLWEPSHNVMAFCDGYTSSSHIVTFYDDSRCHILVSQRVRLCTNRHEWYVGGQACMCFYDKTGTSCIAFWDDCIASQIVLSFMTGMACILVTAHWSFITAQKSIIHIYICQAIIHMIDITSHKSYTIHSSHRAYT
jgi:hypothetical protein